MNIKTRNIFLIMFSIIIIGLLLIKLTLNSYYNKDFNKFNYDKAQQTTIKYLNKNENELKKIVNKLYINREPIQKPYKSISYASYNDGGGLNQEYIKFDMDAQGMLGGQYYGLIYSKKDDEDLIIYDEFKETGKENNIFIRQKIKDNWYFYYDDYDGKVDVDKIRKD